MTVVVQLNVNCIFTFWKKRFLLARTEIYTNTFTDLKVVSSHEITEIVSKICTF